MKFKKFLAVLGVVVPVTTGCSGDTSSNVISETVASPEIISEAQAMSESEMIGAGAGAILFEIDEEEVSSVVKEEEPVIVTEKRLKHDIQKSAALIDAQENKCENVMVSSLSLDMALALATNGADGETLSELEGYLELPVKAYNEYAKDLTSDLPDEMHIANSVWVNDECTIKDDYVSFLKDRYNVQAETINAKDGVGSADRINTWVKENTKEMIDQLVTPDNITPDLFAVLVNAICFEDEWQTPFQDDDIIEKHRFSNIDDSVSYVTMLSESGSGRYLENDTMKAFIKPYKNDRYQFIGILPNSEGDIINKSLAELGVEELLSTDIKYSDDLNIMFPEFEFDYNVQGIIQTMKEQGVQTPFTMNADFSLMSDANLNISSIVQKTKVKVDRKGTKAAAATGTEMLMAEMEFEPPVYIICDRPFVFVIYDTKMDTVAFMGKVVKL